MLDLTTAQKFFVMLLSCRLKMMASYHRIGHGRFHILHYVCHLTIRRFVISYDVTAAGRVLNVIWSSVVRTFRRNLLPPLSGLPNSVVLKCGVSVLLKGGTHRSIFLLT